MELYKGSGRYRYANECPCGKSNKDGKFVPFIIDRSPSPNFGFCHSCGKYFYPDDFNKQTAFIKNSKQPQKPIKTIPKETVIETLKDDGRNNLITWLKLFFPSHQVEKAIFHFNIGTGKKGNTLYWLQNVNGYYLTGKSIFYQTDGHRDHTKPIFSLYPKSKGYGSCIFGEHQLKIHVNETIVIVESEKDAIVGYLNFKKYIWLASGGANGLSYDKIKVLKGRKIILQPHCDNSGRDGFKELKKRLERIGCLVVVVDLDPKLDGGEDLTDMLCSSP